MIDRTLLTEALAWWVDVVADVQTDTFTLTMSRTMARRTLSALERLLDFPTDQHVRVAIQAQRVVDDRIVNGESSEGEFEAMEAALVTVRDTLISPPVDRSQESRDG